MKSTTHLFHGHVQITQPQTAGTSRILLHVGADCHCVTSDLDFASSRHIYIKWDTEWNSHTLTPICCVQIETSEHDIVPIDT